jgi:hypothetical protein
MGMKRAYIITMMIGMCMINISAADYYQSLRTHLAGMGQAIENVNNIPVVGKLTNLVPFAALASSLKECPMQTMVVLTVIGAYMLSYNTALRQMMEKYEFVSAAPWIRRKRAMIEPIMDDSFFTYDEDEEENEIMEDELLNTDLFDGEDDQTKDRKKRSSEHASC